jgi:ABC-2 type transport system ATP-binding protein
MSQRGTGSSWASAVSFEEVSKVYGQVRAVDGLSLDLRHGQTVAFLGPLGKDKISHVGLASPQTGVSPAAGYSPAGTRGRR